MNPISPISSPASAYTARSWSIGTSTPSTVLSSGSATSTQLGGLRGLIQRNIEQRMRFIQNGWLA
jgi:hypothetical protein